MVATEASTRRPTCETSRSEDVCAGGRSARSRSAPSVDRRVRRGRSRTCPLARSALAGTCAPACRRTPRRQNTKSRSLRARGRRRRGQRAAKKEAKRASRRGGGRLVGGLKGREYLGDSAGFVDSEDRNRGSPCRSRTRPRPSRPRRLRKFCCWSAPQGSRSTWCLGGRRRRSTEAKVEKAEAAREAVGREGLAAKLEAAARAGVRLELVDAAE